MRWLTFQSRKVTKLPKSPERNGQTTVCSSVGTGLHVAAQKLVLELSCEFSPNVMTGIGSRLSLGRPESCLKRFRFSYGLPPKSFWHDGLDCSRGVLFHDGPYGCRGVFFTIGPYGSRCIQYSS